MPPGTTSTSGGRHLVERGVDGEAELAVVGAHLATFGSDEDHLGAGEPLQHLVRPDRVERGHLREEQEGDLHVSILAIVWVDDVGQSAVTVLARWLTPASRLRRRRMGHRCLLGAQRRSHEDVDVIVPLERSSHAAVIALAIPRLHARGRHPADRPRARRSRRSPRGLHPTWRTSTATSSRRSHSAEPSRTPRRPSAAGRDRRSAGALPLSAEGQVLAHLGYSPDDR